MAADSAPRCLLRARARALFCSALSSCCAREVVVAVVLVFAIIAISACLVLDVCVLKEAGLAAEPGPCPSLAGTDVASDRCEAAAAAARRRRARALFCLALSSPWFLPGALRELCARDGDVTPSMSVRACTLYPPKRVLHNGLLGAPTVAMLVLSIYEFSTRVTRLSWGGLKVEGSVVSSMSRSS